MTFQSTTVTGRNTRRENRVGLKRLLHRILDADARHRQARAFARLDDAGRRDIGLAPRDDAARRAADRLQRICPW